MYKVKIQIVFFSLKRNVQIRKRYLIKVTKIKNQFLYRPFLKNSFMCSMNPCHKDSNFMSSKSPSGIGERKGEKKALRQGRKKRSQVEFMGKDRNRRKRNGKRREPKLQSPYCLGEKQFGFLNFCSFLTST